MTDFPRRPPPHDGLSYIPDRRPRRALWSYWQMILFFLVFVITIFGLALIPFGISSNGTPPPSTGHGHDDDQHTHDPEPEPHPEPQPTAAPQHEMPSSPRLRDPSEYILDMAWDFDAAPTTREYNWTITNADLNPDGVYRPMYLINNQFPGPLVECNDGDTIIVHVHNQAVNATAIHFHGLFQHGTNFMDGTVGVTQCPIAPRSSFTYTFTVRGQSGTYWYHAHHSAQASDGLLGPVVIHVPDERTALQELDYASDRVIMVQDHYHNLTSELLMDYLQPDMENDEPVPDNALINGRGLRDCADFPGWRCDASDTARPVLDLAPGRRHRLRVLNVGAFAEFQIQFDEHPFYVTEVDGTDVRPEPFHRLNILPAQRYSVVLETNVTTTGADSFWMRARMVTRCFTTKNERLVPELHAVLRYRADHGNDPAAAAVVPEPTSKDWPESVEVICRDLNVSALHPVVAQSPPPADEFVFLRANFMIGDWALARGFFNGSTWHANTTHPSLHRYLDSFAATTAAVSGRDEDKSASMRISDKVFNPERDFVLETTGARTIDLAINNFDDGAHPFHLHGHKFFVLIQGRSGYPPTADELPAHLARHDLLANPLRRDTVTVEGYGWVIVRVVLDNPGLWALHCHNTWHAESGMLMQLLVGSDEVRRWTLPDEQRELCARDGVATGGRPSDDVWFGHITK
ncbi:L-ascorbate oxidase [Cordyceps fumosorosea ARSEF 2679]|uniref:L-ascorbate oxidase n=1 Tax=Cordyceps fumosorosea (strain ARSEF 2679) TaxID=1081104 RepID=A0A167ZJ51_CORFA|nr:L-ascorbate oxidase [Cordyceps fumosorosea ARSEF 2679]OAA67579.1 L-ascorbate oxidase [Cordyceps fumosorosea ARSEF 2679]